jgi:hypothetical protein
MSGSIGLRQALDLLAADRSPHHHALLLQPDEQYMLTVAQLIRGSQAELVTIRPIRSWLRLPRLTSEMRQSEAGAVDP